MKVAIIGAGELGLALAKVLKDKTDILLWDVDASKVANRKSLADVVSGADIIFCAVPSFAMREAVVTLKTSINQKETIVLSLAKGIERPSEKFMDKVLAEILPGGRSGVMGGPMLATELGAGEQCIGALGFSDSNSERVIESVATVEELFAGTNLHIEKSDDVHGIAIAGVLKNIYAVLMGLGAGFKLGEDETGWLATRAMEEMVLIGTHLGAREETITGTAGFADFLATAYSESSRNRTNGILIAKEGFPSLTGKLIPRGEGILSLSSVVDLMDSLKGLPLLSALVDIVIKDQMSEDVFRSIRPRA